MENTNYSKIEFGVGCLFREKSDPLFEIGTDHMFKMDIDDSFRQSLLKMKDVFYKSYSTFPEVAQFKSNKKYSSAERLTYSLNNTVPDLINMYYNAYDWEYRSGYPGNDLEYMAYYFAIFVNQEGVKSIGVKGSTEIKRHLKSRGKLFKPIENYLSTIDDDVYELDDDFDFFIHADLIEILHPNGFKWVAKI
jgi:hypothetical protein